AGPTPMARRRDALVGASRLVLEVNRIGLENQPFACATVGLIQSSPNSRNTIPGKVFFTVDFRHPDDAVLTRMCDALQAAVARVRQELRLEAEIEEIWYSPPVRFADSCVEAVRKAADRLGYAHMDIVSGAGHDAVYVSRVAPTGMIFVPCEDGISHNEIENATRDDIAAGAQVLLHAMLERADAAATGG
ncbi:MAG TPA: M20/M25/M40 family metallo-hydrolase, partial [Stellaceae bacterium]